MVRCLVLAALALPPPSAAQATAPSVAGSKPHIIHIMQDDLGFYDSGIHNPDAVAWSGNISELAREGIVLQHMYTHWHCSPSRRSFLSGRLPIHHGEQLSGNGADDIDLRMTWVSQKLKGQGYKTHWFGKMHTGFRSWQHLAINKGFDSNVGSLQTGGNYGKGHTTRWQNDHPIWSDAQFDDKPAQCGAVKTELECSTTVVEDHIMTCGTGYNFLNSSNSGECCAACSKDDSCTHWVFDTEQASKPPCHLKSGDSSCSSHKKGAVSGAKSPAPPSFTNCTDEYSSDLWGQMAVQTVQEHDPVDPLFMHLCFQAVHSPYQKAPGDPTGNVYRGMLWRADLFIGELVDALKAKGMWEKTLLVYYGDNGGVGPGINYPLRGEKHSNWEGAMRVAAFISGGLIPQKLRGTNSSVNMHVVDWHPTFSALAGADTTDDPPVAPLPVDEADPTKNIYGDRSYPALDGVNVWPMLTEPEKHADPDAAHKHLVLTKEVLIAGRYKLLVSQPHFKDQNSGWKQPDGNWIKSNDDPCAMQDVAPSKSALPVPHPGKRPCLFDLVEDPGEHFNIASQHEDMVAKLWTALNRSILTQRDCSGWSGNIPGPSGSCSPAELIGTCNQACAQAKWLAYGNKDGPICGVPGCDSVSSPLIV